MKGLDKYNFDFMFEAFDIYTMASQAGKNGRYHAAVAFHEILVKQFEKNITRREIRYNHFEDNRITYLRAKYLLNVAISGKCCKFRTFQTIGQVRITIYIILYSKELPKFWFS